MVLLADIFHLASDRHKLPLLTFPPDEIEELDFHWDGLFPQDVARHWPELDLLLQGHELALEGHEVVLNQPTPVDDPEC